ncbi:hypothetical protein ABT099_17180, partial [Streptomyces prasinus]
MSTPVHRTSTRQSAAVLTPARQRREGSRTGSPSRNPAEHALLQLQSSAGNRATTAAVQRARGADKGKAPEGGGADKGKAPEGGGADKGKAPEGGGADKGKAPEG